MTFKTKKQILSGWLSTVKPRERKKVLLLNEKANSTNSSYGCSESKGTNCPVWWLNTTEHSSVIKPSWRKEVEQIADTLVSLWSSDRLWPICHSASVSVSVLWAAPCPACPVHTLPGWERWWRHCSPPQPPGVMTSVPPASEERKTHSTD